MFEKYLATKKDFQAIEEGIKAVLRPELDFVFKKKSFLKNLAIISYDSMSVFLWTKYELPELKTIPCHLTKYHAYQTTHKIKLKDEWQFGWQAALPIRQFQNLLPKRLQKSRFEIPKISGGLLKPFVGLQKKKNLKPNSYTTYESYLATIVHEFAHIYWEQHKLWWYSDKRQNLAYLNTAVKLFEDKMTRSLNNIRIRIPFPQLWSEVFAFCADYYAASLFWPNHKRDIDQMNSVLIKKAIPAEKQKNLEKQNSVFDDGRTWHLAAAILGKIILSRFPKIWPDKLLEPPLI